jgi:hypothetical protein
MTRVKVVVQAYKYILVKQFYEYIEYQFSLNKDTYENALP